MSNKPIYTPREVEDRRELVRPIVSAAYSAKGYALTEVQKEEFVIHWEKMFCNIPTLSLTEFYELGLQKNCTSVETFICMWEAKQQGDAMEQEFLRQQKEANEPAKEYPIPEFIIKKWKLREKGVVPQ